MSCENCRYAQNKQFMTNQGLINEIGCELTHYIIKDINKQCDYYNKDLSDLNICYNCQSYIGGQDYALFCGHPDKKNHIGLFDDKGCEFFNRRNINV